MPSSLPIHRVTAFVVVGPHSLEVRFADGVCRTIDFAPVLAGQLLAPEWLPSRDSAKPMIGLRRRGQGTAPTGGMAGLHASAGWGAASLDVLSGRCLEQ